MAKTSFEEFNFGFQSVMHYLEQADDLLYLVDNFEALEANGVYDGGLVMNAIGYTIAINVTVERDDFAIQVYDNDEQLSLIFLPTGEDLLMFLLSLRRELVDSKYYK